MCVAIGDSRNRNGIPTIDRDARRNPHHVRHGCGRSPSGTLASSTRASGMLARTAAAASALVLTTAVNLTVAFSFSFSFSFLFILVILNLMLIV